VARVERVARAPDVQKGPYVMTLTSTDATFVDKLGTVVFHRDVTYDESSPELAGCHRRPIA
jgi:hypothetical protein